MPDCPNSGVLVLPRMIAAGRLDPLDYDGINLRYAVAEDGGAHGGGNAFGQLQILDGDGYAMQRPQRIATAHGLIGGAGLGQRLVGAKRQVSVQLRIQRVNAPVKQLDQFNRRHFAAGDEAAYFGGGRKSDFVVHGAAPVRVSMDVIASLAATVEQVLQISHPGPVCRDCRCCAFQPLYQFRFRKLLRPVEVNLNVVIVVLIVAEI